MPKMKKSCDESQERWFNEVLERIRKATGARTQVQLAEVLDVRQSSISDAKRRCSVPAEWILKLYRTHGLDPDWLSYGTGSVYLNPARAKVAPEAVLREAPAPYGRAHSRSRTVTVCSTGSGRDGEGVWEPRGLDDLVIPESFHRDSLMVVRMDSTAMEPLIMRSAFVGIDTEQLKCPDGDIFAVYFPGQGLVIRRLYLQNGKYVLRAEREHAEITISSDEMKSRAVGRVCWVMQQVVPM